MAFSSNSLRRLSALLIALLLSFPLLSHAQSTGKPTFVRVVFTELATPSGWSLFNPKSLTPDVLFATGPKTLPEAFQSYIRSAGGFKYIQPLAPGLYTIQIGLVEQSNEPCKAIVNRIFSIICNDKSALNINIFASSGCLVPYIIKLNNVKVGPDAQLKLSVVPVSSSQYPPILSNFEAKRNLPPAKALSTAFPLKITFSSGPAPSNWIRFDPSRALPSVFYTTTLNTDVPEEYRENSERDGGFAYTETIPPGRYRVTFGWAEIQDLACQTGSRVFSVTVNGLILDNIDVFSAVGCLSVYTRFIDNVEVLDDNALILSVSKVSGEYPPFLSTVQVEAMDSISEPNSPPIPPAASPVPLESSSAIPSISSLALESVIPSPTASSFSLESNIPSPTASFSLAPLPTIVSPGDIVSTDTVRLNAGNPSEARIPSTIEVGTTKFVLGTTHGLATVYRTARAGKLFEYSFSLEPGAYNITLGFVEFLDEYCFEPGHRVFNVFINDVPHLEGFDVFNEAGCRVGIEKSITQTVSGFQPKPLVIRFESVLGNAVVSLIYIRPSAQKCIPQSLSGNLTSDHAAHSVPGPYPPQLTASSPKSYVDADGDGFVTVLLDGSRSHTHFFDTENDVQGRVIEYVWTIVNTGEIISKQVSFRYRFPLGVTRLRLSVVDSSCSMDETETSVTVTGSLYPGTYCYFYQNATEVPMGGTPLDSPPPNYALISEQAKLDFPKDTFSQFRYAMRCLFLLQVDTDMPDATVGISSFNTGSARLYKGNDLIIDTMASDTAETSLSVGLTSFEVTFFRATRSIIPSLRFVLNGLPAAASKLSHDRRLVIPIVTSVTPREGQTIGGTTIKITGFGLYQPLQVSFGDIQAKVIGSEVSTEQVVVQSPPSLTTGNVGIVVKTGSGQATNAGSFSYGDKCDSVAFSLNALRQPSGSDVDYLNAPTSIVIWQDGRIYMGTLAGRVQVLTYNRFSLRTISHCYSSVISDEKFKKPDGTPSLRSVLGLTFDPRDKIGNPYISTSTLWSLSESRISSTNIAWWRNGAIDRLKPGTDPLDGNVCLVYDRRIVTNLPVSNNDHSVNSILFTQTGDLLIAQGGNTNAGLPSFKLGGMWETALSGAVLIARLSKPDFDGHIRYKSKKNHFTAVKSSGHVSVYASGLRNLFGMTMTSTGDVYGVDQGVNCDFGDVATSCSNFDIERALSWNITGTEDWPGVVAPAAGGCRKSAIRSDKIVHITKGSFYGHPNLMRKKHECAWIDPYSDATADGKAAPAKYKKPLGFLTSSVTGIGEYRANNFCGRLKGELVMTSYKGGSVYRMAMNRSEKISGPDIMAKFGGIAFAENEYGDLIIPRNNVGKVSVLRPSVAKDFGLYATGLNPFRHGAQGGTIVTIAGGGFIEGGTVTIGGKPCQILVISWTKIRCVVPPHVGGAMDIVLTMGGSSVALKSAVLYMLV